MVAGFLEALKMISLKTERKLMSCDQAPMKEKFIKSIKGATIFALALFNMSCGETYEPCPRLNENLVEVGNEYYCAEQCITLVDCRDGLICNKLDDNPYEPGYCLPETTLRAPANNTSMNSNQQPNNTNSAVKKEACTADLECESNECQRGFCKLTNFAVIPSGSFIQGSPASEPDRLPNESQRAVTITRAFFMQETEVTQDQWEALMGNNPSHFRSPPSGNRPVEMVSWWDAIAYTNTLSVNEGLEQCYSLLGCSGTPGLDYLCTSISFKGLDCEGYRLPTEAEWEYAARAGTTEMTYAGNHGAMDCIGDAVLSEIAWWCGNSGEMTHDVGGKTENAWGLYDMIGNVFEWNWDWHSTYGSGPIDPIGPTEGYFRIVRGCSWSFHGQYCRAAYRFGGSDGLPSFRYNNVGFRPARSIP